TEAPLVNRRRLARVETAAGLDVECFSAEFWVGPRADLWGLDRRAIEEILASERPATVMQAVRRLGALYARGRGKRRYGLQGPDHVTHIALLAARLPEARFVHVIRDGRDVSAGLCDADFGA